MTAQANPPLEKPVAVIVVYIRSPYLYRIERQMYKTES